MVSRPQIVIVIEGLLIHVFGTKPTALQMSLYWKCQTAGWSLYALIGAGIPMLYGGPHWEIVGRVVLGTAAGIVLTHGLRLHIWRNAWFQLSFRRLALRVIAASVLIAAAMVLVILPFLLRVFVESDPTGPIAAVLVSYIAIVFGWILVYLGYHFLDRVRAIEREKWRLQLAMRDTELRALRAQLNPHFLFNSLNSLRGLVLEDAARAQEVITALAALLRHTLQLSRVRTTTLEQEIDATRHYLELETLRFESRLRYEIDVDESTLAQAVPPMMIQTLVENAIKHGIARLPEGGVIRITARRRSSDFLVCVSNTGTLKDPDKAHGVGLTNSLERLRLVFGESASLDLKQSRPNEVTCEIAVPSPARRPPSEVSERRRAS